MYDDINEDIDNPDNEEEELDTDIDLEELDISKVNNFNSNVNTGYIDMNNSESSMFAANNLLRKTADNLAFSEAMVDEKPLRTEKTDELERREREDLDK